MPCGRTVVRGAEPESCGGRRIMKIAAARRTPQMRRRIHLCSEGILGRRRAETSAVRQRRQKLSQMQSRRGGITPRKSASAHAEVKILNCANFKYGNFFHPLYLHFFIYVTQALTFYLKSLTIHDHTSAKLHLCKKILKRTCKIFDMNIIRKNNDSCKNADSENLRRMHQEKVL